MPRGDGTGPLGQGPMTGRGMGFCAGYRQGGYMRPRWGLFGAGRGGIPWGGGMGRAWGGGRGRCRAPYPIYNYPYSYEYDISNLEEEKHFVNKEIGDLESRIEELKKYLAEIEKEENK
jgi:hypothetical protein